MEYQDKRSKKKKKKDRMPFAQSYASHRMPNDQENPFQKYPSNEYNTPMGHGGREVDNLKQELDNAYY